MSNGTQSGTLQAIDQSLLALAQQQQVPDRIPISQDDWDAMPVEERSAAIAFFREEEQEGRGLPVTFPRIAYPTSGASHCSPRVSVSATAYTFSARARTW